MRERRETSGFPSPAEDHIEETLDLQQLLIKRPAATFYLEMTGNAMRGLGIYDHDVLVVDRSLTPTPNSIVVIALDGDMLVRRWCPQPGPERRLLLVAAHSAYSVLQGTPEMSCETSGDSTTALRPSL